jgi:hypothetical protein
VLLAVVGATTARTRRRLAVVVGSIACLVLVAMVIGNTQGSVAPLTLTMLGG